MVTREDIIGLIISKHQRRPDWDRQDFFESDVENCMIEFSNWENETLQKENTELKREVEILKLEKEKEKILYANLLKSAVHPSHNKELYSGRLAEINEQLTLLKADLKP